MSEPGKPPPPLERLEQLAAEALQGGGAERLARQHRAGRLSARERLELLLDPGSFVELDRFVTHRCTDFGTAEQRPLGDGVVVGHGQVRGRLTFVFAQDATVFGGSLGHAHAAKVCKLMDLAERAGAPIVGLNDSGGARIQEGVASLGGYAEIFLRNTLLSGVVPQISVVLGPCAGGAVYSPALTDFILMAEGTAQMFITGPDVIKAVTHEEVTKEQLGGATTHHRDSGVAHFSYADEASCLEATRELLSFLPQNNSEEPPSAPNDDPVERCAVELDTMVPDDPSRAYDIKSLIAEVVDEGYLFEVQRAHAGNIVVGFARLGGRVVGVVANQPAVLAGCLDIKASLKAARFVRTCDCFNIPLVTFVDVPGFLPGSDQEYGGIIKHGAKLLYAYAEATVPKVTVITRKAYGGAYDVMASKHLRADLNLAYPTAEIAVMGPAGAVNVLYRQELAAAAEGEREPRRAEYVARYRAAFANPYKAAELGYLDDVIVPHTTRPRLIAALRMLRNKRQSNPPRKHGNIPL
ncbi:MAG: acyl-CoA carboxylase subunit beta [Proteobacteria bacterium]|nr:acyl-CoA carboxylase subunit beta [Pseudomonadota bacterium]